VKRMVGEPTMVRVVWDDAWSGDEKVAPVSHYYEQEYLALEVGFLKTITKREVVICRNWTIGTPEGKDQIVYDACIRIPRGMVRSITVLALTHQLRGSSAGSVSKSSRARKTSSAK